MPALFDDDVRTTKEDDIAIAKKLKSKKPTARKKSGGILEDIENIRKAVEENLGQYADDCLCITDECVMHDYISECISNEYVAVDTETEGLNPLIHKIAGPCLFTRGQKGVYVPVNHVSYITGEKSPGQLDAEFVISELLRLFNAKLEVDMFNAVFDIRVLRQFGVHNAYCTWDSSLGSRLLNENEPLGSGNLKDLHNKYCLGGKGDAFRFDDLFNKVTFIKVPYRVGAIYAAHDPVITSEYGDFQRQFLRADHEREDMRKLYWVFKNIEMPMVDVICDLEDTGVLFDFDKNAELKDKYHKLLDEREVAFHKVCEPVASEINAYRIKNIGTLDNPLNIKSTKQLGILLYDILGLEQYYDKKKKKYTKSTSEDVLKEKLQKGLDGDAKAIVQAILDYREFSTLVSTFIDKLPNCVHTDNRIHCKFNSMGADTGRMSSSDPNMQNIPSHCDDIRQMFKATDGYVLLSSDYSQQEPSCLAAFCKEAGADALYNARFKGNDLYSEVASACFKLPYEVCCEFDENGNKNPPEYKERRGQAKPVLLGILYGRGDPSVAEQMNISLEEAKQLKENLFHKFPEIHDFERDSLEMARTLGYVTTVCGRKRRLPDLQLPEYEFVWKDGKCPYDDPLDFEMVDTLPVPDDVQDYYYNKLVKTKWYKEKLKIIDYADKEGIKVIDNHNKIADATRQCVNARIQGSAADLTKLAMIKLHNSERLKELGFRMLIPVHDEIIAECPEENAKECAKLLADTMSEAAQEILHMPFSCDVEVSRCWYGESIEI